MLSPNHLLNRAEPATLEKKNYCFIISNNKFDGKDDLPGYTTDVTKIVETFTGLNFEVELEENKDAEEMLGILKEWSKLDYTNADEIMVLFILSHGDGYGKMYGTDGSPINIRQIKSLFSNERCRQLAGKPKLIFVQTCRGVLIPDSPVEIDSYVKAGPSAYQMYRDMLVFFSTTEGYVSLVDEIKGTYFIDSICNTLQNGSISLSKLLTAVNEKVSTTTWSYKREILAQASEAIYTVRSDIIFPVYKSSNVDLVKNSITTVRYNIEKRNPCIVICSNENNDIETMKDDVTTTFESLNFQVDLLTNMASTDIKEEYKDWKHIDCTDEDCFTCVIFSHGGLKHEDMEVMYGVDGRSVSLENLISSVTTNKTLSGKPKLFFIVLRKLANKSQENKSADGGLVAAGIENIIKKARFADIFVYYVLLECDNSRSLFIKTLCETMLESAKLDIHLEEMILTVNRLVAEQKDVDIIPEARSTLTYDVYFKYDFT